MLLLLIIIFVFIRLILLLHLLLLLLICLLVLGESLRMKRLCFVFCTASLVLGNVSAFPSASRRVSS